MNLLFPPLLSLRGQPGWTGQKPHDERSHVAVVACGLRLEETLTMLKSAVLLSMKPLHFYIFAEDDLHDSFHNAVSNLLCSTICVCFFHIINTSYTFSVRLKCLSAYVVFKLNSWPTKVQARFSFNIYPITFPSENGKEWKRLFKPCASQRLFLPVGLQSFSHECRIFKWLL